MPKGKTVIWTRAGCRRCEQVKTLIGDGNYEEHPAQALLNGLEPNLDAMVQLAEQNMELPVILHEEEFIKAEEILGALAVCAGEACKVKTVR